MTPCGLERKLQGRAGVPLAGTPRHESIYQRSSIPSKKPSFPAHTREETPGGFHPREGPQTPVEWLVVGDVHGDWDAVDETFLLRGTQDLVLFVGDFGDEDLELVACIAALDVPKAVILGNHDAWFAMRGRRSERALRQIEMLGADHLGFAARSVAGGALAVVGGRPFTWGGEWGRYRSFYARHFGVDSDRASMERIVAAADEHPGVPLVLLGHNGPRGLGEGADAIFGRDFRKPFIDFGDPDLQLALEELQRRGRKVAATIAGHMHHILRGGGSRRRVAVLGGTVHLNAAVVPRHVPAAGGKERHFMRVVIAGGECLLAEDLWVDDRAHIVRTERLHPLSESRPRS